MGAVLPPGAISAPLRFRGRAWRDSQGTWPQAAEMMHTFLFEPGVWTSKGTFWRADGEPLEAQGRTEIAHHPATWLLSGTLKVFGSPPVEFVNAYSINPPGRDATCMKWSAEDATLGKLSGTFSVVGTSILCVYTCTASGYHGAEHMGQLDAHRYNATGILLLNERRLSSWQLVLTRKPGGGN